MRIPCTTVDLWVVEPMASEEIVTAALRLVEGMNLDDNRHDDLEGFGAGLQEEHSRLTEEALAAASDPGAERVRSAIRTVSGLLRDLDPEVVFGLREEGFLGALRALADVPPDPDAIFAATYPRLRNAVAALKGMLTDLGVLADRLSSLGERQARLERRIAAHVVAARFLVGHMRADPGLDDVRRARHWSQADRMEGRLRSLLVTAETLEDGRRTLAAARDRVAALAATAGEVVNEVLPTWHTAYAAALAARRGGAESASVDGLRAAHRDVLRTLAKEEPS